MCRSEDPYRLSARLDEVERQLEQLRRHVYGKKSEKVPSIERELRKERPLDRKALPNEQGPHSGRDADAKARPNVEASYAARWLSTHTHGEPPAARDRS